MSAAALGACAEPTCAVVALAAEAPVVDECGSLCVRVELTPECGSPLVQLSSDVDGPMRPVAIDAGVPDSGRVCASTPLTPGVHTLTASLEAAGGGERLQDDSPVAVVEVRPFGWSYGLDRPLVDEEPLVLPEVLVPESPVLAGDAGTWDAASVLAPSGLAGQGLVAYAGTAQEGAWAPYRLGIAAWDEELSTWTRTGPLLAGSPGAQAGGWSAYARNTPHLVAQEDALWLYYTGRDTEDGVLSIGLATSEDGRVFVEHPSSPVLVGSGREGGFDEDAVAHPSVGVRDGVFEMWYAGGRLAVGYALSADGLVWERYCGNPVLQGLGPESWDGGDVKSPEVVFDGERYWMTYSGGGRGAYQLGWATSADGLRWTLAEAPLLAPEPQTWASQAVQEGHLHLRTDVQVPEWEMWFAGNDGEVSQIGQVRWPADAER